MAIFILTFLAFAQVPDFEETFAFGLTHDWRICDPVNAQSGPSQWYVEEGILHQNSFIHGSVTGENECYLGTRLFLSEPIWRDGAFLTRLSLQEEGAFSLLFRVQDSSHYYRFLLLNNGYLKESELRLDRREGLEFTSLACKRLRLSYPSGPWWIIGIELDNDSFQVFLNDEPLLTAQDSVFPMGGIGLACWKNGGLRVDSLLFSEKQVNRNRFKPGVSLLKGPVIGCLSPHGFEVAWETSLPSPSLVEMIDGSETTTLGDESNETLFHRVKVNGLEPGKSYKYKVISGSMVSPVYGVRIPHEHSSKISFCVYSNSYQDADAHRFVIRSISRKTPDLVFHLGNLVEDGSHYEQWFPQFFDPADWIIHSMPFLLCAGNHERGSPWLQTFAALPGNGQYYSYSYGNAYFVVLDANQPVEPGSPQADWLEEALQNAESGSAHWRFCFIHEIPACEEQGDKLKEHSVHLENRFLDLLQEAGFDMLFTGKKICYERQVYRSLHLVNTGGGGAPLDLDAVEERGEDRSAIQHRSVWHACKVQVEEGRLTFTAFTPDGKPFDTLELKK